MSVVFHRVKEVLGCKSARHALRCYRPGYVRSHLALISEAQSRCITEAQVRSKDSRYVLGLL